MAALAGVFQRARGAIGYAIHTYATNGSRAGDALAHLGRDARETHPLTCGSAQASGWVR